MRPQVTIQFLQGFGMCGRYALYGPVSRLRERFDAEFEDFELTSRYNAAPMQWLPVVRQRPGGERVIHLLRWGLVPSWSKDEAIATKTINARGQSAAEKAAFRAAFRRRRCIVPANAFYEWQTVAGDKQPFYIHPVGAEFFALAGLWERWTRPGDGESIDTFTIVTTAAMPPCARYMTGCRSSWRPTTLPGCPPTLRPTRYRRSSGPALRRCLRLTRCRPQSATFAMIVLS